MSLYTDDMPKRDDFIGQNNPNVQIYAAENGLIPDYVDEAPVITEEDIAQLDNTAFANPYARTYPCHTKVACVQSALWDAATNPGNELVTNNIKRAAAAHGVAEDVDKIYTFFSDAFQKAAAPKPVAQPEPQYAITLADDAGRQTGFFETTYSQDVLNSAEEADRQYRAGNIGEPEFRKIATAIVEAAEQHALPVNELPRTIQVYGTDRLPDPYGAEIVVRDFCKRSNVNPDPYMRGVNQLQQAMAQSDAIEDMIKMANMVADQMVQLNLHNGIVPKTQDSPYTLLFSGPTRREMQKRAANTVYIMDVPVPAQAMLQLPATTIERRFAPQAAGVIKQAQARLQQDDMEKAAAAAELISTMSPAAIKQLLKTLVQEG